MTDTPVKPARRLRLWLLVTGLIAVIVIAGVDTSSLVLSVVRDEGYGPVTPGDGSALSGPGLLTDEDGTLRLRPAAGPAYMYSFLLNHGRHSVRIDSVRNHYGGAALWASSANAYDLVVAGPWRPFPATVPARGVIRVRFGIVRPSTCKDLPKNAGYNIDYDAGYEVRWRSRRSTHVTEVGSDRAQGARLAVC